jgi:hypothetical protein
VNTQATTNCYKANPGSGPLANNLCFVDFTPLSNPAYMAVAETPNTCLEMSASLGPAYNYDKLFFCINITEPNGSNPTTGATPTDPQPWPVPTYSGAFFGNLVSVNGSSYAFYTGIKGDPAIYERVKSNNYADLTTITFSHITVVTGSNATATGWAIVSADAESTDATSTTAGDYEGLTWTADKPLSVVPNDIPVLDGTNEVYPAGNACLSDQAVSGLVGGVGTGNAGHHLVQSRHGNRTRDRQSKDRCGDGHGDDADNADHESDLGRSGLPRTPGHRLRDVLTMSALTSSIALYGGVTS